MNTLTDNNFNVTIQTIIETTSGHIFVDTVNNILNLKVLNEKYNNDEFIQLCLTLKEFFNQAYKNKMKYFLLFDVRQIGPYPLGCYDKVKKTLEELSSIIPYVLHSTCVVVDKNLASQILKFFFNIYKPLRPAKIINIDYEAIDFFNNNINMQIF